MFFKRLLCSFFVLGATVVADFPPIKVKGSKFFFENGTQFFIKGIAYQQDTAAAGARSSKTTKYVDPLADAENCQRDIPLLKELGTNTIRTYAIDPSADHSACMKLLQDAGIYVISDLSEPSLSINRDDPQWNIELFERYQKVVDELAKYPNVIGFFAGNEVSDKNNNTGASAYVKAAVRDTKKYIKNNSNIKRWLGVGYAANDDKEIRDGISNYFNCDKEEDSIDFWGYNIYSWCGESNIDRSSYSRHADYFRNYSVPVFFSEYGCNEPGGAEARIFQETGALYSEKMSSIFSGGIVYMYFQEANDYGLVQVEGRQVTRMKNFEALKKQVVKADPKGVLMSDYSPSEKMGECPALSSNWRANKSLPPTPDQTLCDCMVKSLSCVPKESLSSEKFGEIFGYLCAKEKAACDGIDGNTTTGVYGMYSTCDDRAKLAYIMDAYYKHQKNGAYACDFDGAATTQSPEINDSCDAAIGKASIATATKPSAAASTGKDEENASRAVSISNGLYPFAASFCTILWFFFGGALVMV
ncbi:carbohydrate-binding module family 43 protein [Trichoderma velutinum]